LSWRLRALIMGIGKTARKPRQYRLIRAKGPVNQWFGGFRSTGVEKMGITRERREQPAQPGEPHVHHDRQGPQ
jgi:hypothetical protein